MQSLRTHTLHPVQSKYIHIVDIYSPSEHANIWLMFPLDWRKTENENENSEMTYASHHIRQRPHILTLLEVHSVAIFEMHSSAQECRVGMSDSKL